MKKFWQDFKKFISRGNVVDMAVGVAVASAFTKIVNAFTNGFISPLLALLTGGASLSDAKTVVRPEISHIDEAGVTVVEQSEVAILWGAFIQVIIDFLIIALALFIVMRVSSALRARAEKITKSVTDMLNAEAAEKAAAEAEANRLLEEEKAKAEAEAKRLEEERLAAEAKAERDRLESEIRLLTEIRDLLKNK